MRFFLATIAMMTVTTSAFAGKLILANSNEPTFMIDIRCTAQGPSVATLRETAKDVFKGGDVSNMEGSCEETKPEDKVIPLELPTNESKAMTLRILSPTQVVYSHEDLKVTYVFDAEITRDAKGVVQKILIKDTEFVKKARKVIMKKMGPAAEELAANPMARKLIFYINDLLCKRVGANLVCKTVGGMEMAIGQ